MLLSSAYRTKRWPRRSNSRSSSSSTRLLSSGESGPPCGVPSTLGDQPVLHHPGIQERPNEFQQPLVLDPFGDLTHQFVVRDSIEEFLQIKIHAPAAAFGDIRLRLCHRLMSRPSRPEPVAVIGKRPVPPPLQNLHHPLLDESIYDRRDAKLSYPSVRLGDFHPPHRFRFICPLQ